jgi:sugar phosphate permease
MKNVFSYIFGALTASSWWIILTGHPEFFMITIICSIVSVLTFLKYLIENWDNID